MNHYLYTPETNTLELVNPHEQYVLISNYPNETQQWFDFDKANPELPYIGSLTLKEGVEYPESMFRKQWQHYNPLYNEWFPINVDHFAPINNTIETVLSYYKDMNWETRQALTDSEQPKELDASKPLRNPLMQEILANTPQWIKDEIDAAYPDLKELEAEVQEGEPTDTHQCKKCGGRTALITGFFHYEPDEEPYMSGVQEEAKVERGECWMAGYKCDDCGNEQDFWTE